MTTYAFGGPKGGVGKTTLSLNFAAVLSGMGRNVAVLGLDEQNGIEMITSKRTEQNIPQFFCAGLKYDEENPTAVSSNIKHTAKQYDDVIVDCPPGADQPALQAALLTVDVLVSPIKPGVINLNSLKEMNVLLAKAREFNPDLKAFAVINDTSFGATDDYTEQTRTILYKFKQYSIMASQIGSRRPVLFASDRGLSVFEYQDRIDRVAKAREEMEAFIKELLNG
jgi:chromosome partitioning protein